ncbi:MAG: site-specific integrase, partial [Treponemataceae bacterium]|nr:site-specific integrase [Treponemataceae bacterium]
MRTVQEAKDEFLDYLGSVRDMSPHTVVSYRNDLAQFEVMDGIGAQTGIATVTTETLRRCIGTLSRQHRAPASINRFIAAVRGLFSYCKKCGYLAVNPALELRTVKNPQRLPRFMPGPEVDKISDATAGTELLWEASYCA